MTGVPPRTPLLHHTPYTVTAPAWTYKFSPEGTEGVQTYKQAKLVGRIVGNVAEFGCKI